MRQSVFCRVAGKLSVSYIKRMIRMGADVENKRFKGAENAD